MNSGRLVTTQTMNPNTSIPSSLPVWIARLCFIVPIACVHLTWLTGTLAGNLEPCITYWHSCHSISATGRQYPEFFLFKALMLPVAVLMALYWLMINVWWHKVSADSGRTNWIVVMGLIACIALIVYTVTLGSLGEPYKVARRTGIVFFFVMTSFAHLLLLRQLLDAMTRKQLPEAISSLIVRFKWLCFSMVISGLISGILGYVWAGWDDWENAFEWWFSGAMMAQFALLAQMFHRTGFSLSFHLEKQTSTLK